MSTETRHERGLREEEEESLARVVASDSSPDVHEMNVYKAEARYGRGEMVLVAIIGAPDKATAKRVANEACPVPCRSPANDIECWQLFGVTYRGVKAEVITKA